MPIIEPIPDQNITVGLNVTFNCIATGFGLSYMWDIPFFNSGAATVIGRNTQTITLYPVTNNINGKYTCTVTDFTGTNTTSNRAQLIALSK